jgi:hypothetical protein
MPRDLPVSQHAHRDGHAPEAQFPQSVRDGFFL